MNKLKAVALVLFVFSCVPAASLAESEYRHQQQTADTYYMNGDFDQAYKQYLKLAKKGDSFSQYRVSYMFLEGEGRKADVIESFAWAVLAAEDGQEDLVSYRSAVAGLVPEKKRGKAERKADYYMRKWGNLALADAATRRARKQLRECTGSRLGTRCEEVYAMEMPNFWGVNPGDGTGEVGGSAAPSGSVASGVGNSTGAPIRDVAHYQALREQIRALDSYIQENSGTVELGEFEVLEPDEASGQNASDADRESG
jgi:hypothetical protein